MNNITRIAPSLDPSLFEQRIIGRWARSASSRRKYHSEENCFKLGQDLSGFADLCREPESIAKACGFTSQMREEEIGGRHGLYVVGVDGIPVSKIGVSRCPVLRRDCLQQNHWADLSLHAVLWCCVKKAETIEGTALKAAEEMGVRLNGEWVAMEPSEALELLLKAARYTKLPVCDSATWMANWNVRTRALAAALNMPRAA